MAKKYKVLHWINTEIFPANIMVSSGFAYDEIIKLLKQKKAKQWQKVVEFEKSKIIESGYWGMVLHTIIEHPNGNREDYYTLILKNEFDFKDASYCKLAHEVLHLCQFILPVYFNRDREYESEAYYHTHLMSSILKVFRG